MIFYLSYEQFEKHFEKRIQKIRETTPDFNDE